MAGQRKAAKPKTAKTAANQPAAPSVPLNAFQAAANSVARVLEGVAAWSIGSGLVLLVLEESEKQLTGGKTLVAVGVCAILGAILIAITRKG